MDERLKAKFNSNINLYYFFNFMKFLLCGCFHGRVPRKLISVAKKKKVDYVLSTGDFYNYDYFRKLIFKYPKETKGADEPLKNIIGRKSFYEWLSKINKT